MDSNDSLKTEWYSRSSANSSHEEQLQSLVIKRSVVQKEIRTVARNLSDLHLQDGELEHQMRLSIFRSSLIECRAFAREFHARLPPELRNLVYSFAWTPKLVAKASQKWHVAVTSSSDAVPWMRDRDDRLYKNFHWKRMTLWVLPPFVGCNVAREAAAFYYSSRLPADIVGPKYIYLLEKLLTVDHLFMGIVPADHIRRLELRVSASSCRPLSEKSCAWRMSEEGLVIIRQNFNTLDKLKLKNDFHLDVTISSNMSGSQTHKVVEALQPVCSKLKEAGANIRLWGRLKETYGDISDLLKRTGDIAAPPPRELDDDSGKGTSSPNSSASVAASFLDSDASSARAFRIYSFSGSDLSSDSSSESSEDDSSESSDDGSFESSDNDSSDFSDEFS